jgi:RNA polymerase sigma-70 factor, ECF subfamily
VCATGLSYEETAEVCGCAVGTIKSRIARARDRLVELLGEDAARVSSPNHPVESIPDPDVLGLGSGRAAG